MMMDDVDNREKLFGIEKIFSGYVVRQDNFIVLFWFCFDEP